MVNIAELLKKSIEKQKLKPTSEVRQHIYEKARSAIKSKLDEMDALELVQRSYMLQLEAAICEVEAFYVLEPEFFEIKDDGVTCHFAYQAYLPEYFGTRQDIAVDPSNLRSLTYEQNKLVSLKKVDTEPEALTLQAESSTFNLQEEEKKSVLPQEAYPVDIEIAAEPRHDDRISLWTKMQDLADKQDDDGDESHIEPLIEGLEEEFNALSKDIANEALANANNNGSEIHNADDAAVPSKLTNQVDTPITDQVHTQKEHLKIDDNELANKSQIEFIPEEAENTISRSSRSLNGKDTEGQRKTAEGKPQNFQHHTLIASELKDDNRQTTDRSEAQQKQAEPSGNGSSSKPPFASHLHGIRNRMPNGRNQQMRVDNYPLYIDMAAYASSARGVFNGSQRVTGNRLASDPISSGLKPRQPQEIRQETVFKRETVVMATPVLSPDPAKNEPKISERQTQYQQEVLQRQPELERTFSKPKKNQVMTSSITAERVVASDTAEIHSDLTSEHTKGEDIKKCSLSKEEQLLDVAVQQPMALSNQEREAKSQTEQSSSQSSKFNDDREQKKENDENTKSYTEAVEFSSAKPDADEITALIQKTSSAGKKISEANDNKSGEVGSNDKKEESEHIKASASSDAAEKFEKKRAEFFDGLSEVQPEHIKQDLFPKISSASADSSNKNRKKTISGTRNHSLLANSWVTRSIAAGFIVLCVLSVGIYVFNRVEMPDVATSTKIGETTDPSKTAAISHATSSDEVERLLRERYASTDSAKDNKSDVNIKEEKTYQNATQKDKQLPFNDSSEEKVLDTPQSDLLEKPIDHSIKDASLPSSIVQPSVGYTPAKEAMVGSQDDQKEQDKTSDAEQVETTLKQESGLLLLTDKKGKQIKMQGSVSWSLLPPHVQENPLNETALVAQFRTNDGKLGVRMSIRKNYRQNLGATHLIDLAFSQSDNFDGGVVVDVKGIYFGNKVNVLNKQASTIIADLYENNFVASLRNDTDNKEVNRDFIEHSTVMGVETMLTDGKMALFILNKGQGESKLFETFNAKTTH